MVAESGVGSDNALLAVAVHPLASEIVIVYVPALTPVIDAVVAALLQLYV